MINPKHERRLKKLHSLRQHIYGIFDFKTLQLVYVHLDCNNVETEFDLELYDEDQYDIVEFDVLLS